jgi:hypothetical protein
MSFTIFLSGFCLAGFVQWLRELGWIEARNIVIEVRRAEGRSERFAEIEEIVRLKVDVIVTHTTPAILAKQATSTSRLYSLRRVRYQSGPTER